MAHHGDIVKETEYNIQTHRRPQKGLISGRSSSIVFWLTTGVCAYYHRMFKRPGAIRPDFNAQLIVFEAW